jgi:hypothetical protein
MGHRWAQYLNEIHVSERDLLVGDCRRRRWSFISCLDFRSVLRTQKGRQGLVRLSWRPLSFQPSRLEIRHRILPRSPVASIMRVLWHPRRDRPEPRCLSGRRVRSHDPPDGLVTIEHVVIRPRAAGAVFGGAFEGEDWHDGNPRNDANAYAFYRCRGSSISLSPGCLGELGIGSR